MNNQNFQTVYGVKIYPIEYIGNEDLSDNDLSNLLDNDRIGLKYSFIIGMFRHANSKKTNSQIINMIKTDDKWFKKIRWTKSKRDEYENFVIKAYKNIFQFNDTTAKSLGEWFMTVYGFSVENNNIDL